MTKLIEEWREVMLKAWSVRWMVFANMLGAAPALADGLDDYVSPRTMLKVMVLANCAALVARFMKQDNMPSKS